ncbi:MAG: GNAT family N-acetyltransferase [Coprobacillus sp.]
MKTRLYMPSDLDDVLELFYDSVHHVNAKDYTPEQLDGWAPKVPDIYRWEESLNKNHTLVVEENNEIIGFGNIGETGYLDRLYVGKDHLHKGVASLLINEFEKYAKAKGIVFMNTASSITAMPFFESVGYKVLEEQTVERRGVRLRRFLMEKKL